MKSENRIWKIIDIIEWGTNFFKVKGIESPRLNIELLLCKVLNYNRVKLYVRFEQPLLPNELSELRGYVKRRAAREPLYYITGEIDFYDIKLKVNQDVLIPRPETELLVEKVILDNNKRDSVLRIIDIGTGSGCIAISLAKHLPFSKVMAIDISDKALEMAEVNAKLNNIDNIEFQKVDILNSFPLFKERFDIVVSNPPYVSLSEFDSLQPEIMNYEPKMAVTDYDNGLVFYSRFVTIFSSLLSSSGRYYLELNSQQSIDVYSLFMKSGLNPDLTKDLAGFDRIISGRIN